MKERIKDLLKKSRLKYNYFSNEHPNKEFRGKLFKFLNKNTIQFLTTKETAQVSKDELGWGDKKLYSPADMGQ